MACLGKNVIMDLIGLPYFFLNKILWQNYVIELENQHIPFLKSGFSLQTQIFF